MFQFVSDNGLEAATNTMNATVESAASAALRWTGNGRGAGAGSPNRPLGIRARLTVGMTAACVALIAVADHLQVSDSGLGAYEVSLTRSSDGLVVAWYDTRDGNAEIYLRQLDPEGAMGAEFRITHDLAESYEADVDAARDGIAIAWYDKDNEGRLAARLAFWHPDNGIEWRTLLSARGGASRNPVVRAEADRIFTAWIEADTAGAEAVWGGWWSTSGEARQAPVELGPASATTWNLNADLGPSGVAYVVFDARVDTLAEELYVAKLKDTHVELRRLTDDDGHRSKYPDLALSNGRAALTWFDERDGRREVYLYAGALDSLGEEMELLARRITDTPGESKGAYVAWNGERIGLAWSDEQCSGAYDVYFQAFDLHGEPAGAAHRLTATPESSLIPAIRAWNEGFVVAWNEVAPGPEGVSDPATRSEVHLAIVP